jgi:LDH2 family malate/lactate/ureidoglycolate dehydrogenase
MTRHDTQHDTTHVAYSTQATYSAHVVIGWEPTDPFVLDMATTTVALGKVEIRDREERQCPAGWGG